MPTHPHHWVYWQTQMVVVVDAIEDSKTTDNGDSGLGGTGTWSPFCMRIETAP